MEYKEFLLSLNGEPIGTSASVAFKQSPEWEFYLKRKNTYWFRNLFGSKIRLDNPTGLELLKYGDRVDMDYSL